MFEMIISFFFFFDKGYFENCKIISFWLLRKSKISIPQGYLHSVSFAKLNNGIRARRHRSAPAKASCSSRLTGLRSCSTQAFQPSAAVRSTQIAWELRLPFLLLWVSRLFSLLLSQSLKSSIILRRHRSAPALCSTQIAWEPRLPQTKRRVAPPVNS